MDRDIKQYLRAGAGETGWKSLVQKQKKSEKPRWWWKKNDERVEKKKGRRAKIPTELLLCRSDTRRWRFASVVILHT